METRKPIVLKQEEVLHTLPEKIGKVSLDYRYYPGKDLYSDGEIENELLSIVKTSARVEYPSIIEERNSWPVLYHLSPLRSNIVDWLPITRQDKVLEIGSGCGAITEKLAEKAGSVTCVDLSAKRSEINARRNQDRDNITIHVGNFKDIEPELPTDYDYICLIGVFEYGASYIQTKEPYEDFLKIMLRHQKKDGRMVIAIENRLGLKYFAGCQEDHLGNYFSSLEGYPEGGSARTFSRPAWEKLLKKCGVAKYSFYYPYPDYKFPEVIFSDKRLPHQGELTNNMRNFDRHRMDLFHEKYVFDSLITDELFPYFSNSYLLILGEELPTVYMKYSNDRAAEFQISTEMQDTAEGRILLKKPLTEQAGAHVRSMEKSYQLLSERFEGSDVRLNPCTLTKEGYASFPFEEGVTLETLLDQCLEKEDKEGFYRLFDQYLACISYGEESKVTDYDLIFSNILVNQEKFTIIDYEWTRKEQISSKEIAFRAIYCYLLEEEKRNKLNLDYIIQRLGITESEAEEYREKELKFQKQVTGKRKSMGDLLAAIGTYHVDMKRLMQSYLQNILDKRIQVYYDRGNGFSESDSRYLPDVYTDENTIEATISFDGNIKALRIDPADCACVVKIETMRLNGQEISINRKRITVNGKELPEQTYVFATEDPGMTLVLKELPLQGENELEMVLHLSKLPMDIAQNLVKKGRFNWRH